MSNFRKDGDDRHVLIYHHPCRHLLFIVQPYIVDTSLCKTIVGVPYVDTNAKVTNCFPFCTIGISMYQKHILPYTLFPSYLPQADSLLEHYGQTVCLAVYFITPCSLSSFFPLSARGPTRRRSSTGLAKLWGGWPIEVVGVSKV